MGDSEAPEATVRKFPKRYIHNFKANHLTRILGADFLFHKAIIGFNKTRTDASGDLTISQYSVPSIINLIIFTFTITIDSLSIICLSDTALCIPSQHFMRNNKFDFLLYKFLLPLKDQQFS